MKKFWNSKRFIIPAALLMVGVIATVAAVTLLFTHTFPSVTVPGQPNLVTGLCISTTLVATLVTPSSPSGALTFGCTSATGATFTTGAKTVAVTASGAIPSGYTDLFAIPTTSPPLITGISCAAAASSIALLSPNPAAGGTAVTVTTSSGTGLAAGTSYYYCADYINPSASSVALPTFTVAWEQ